MFNRDEVRLIREQIQAALNELGEQLDLDLKLGSARFLNTINFKLEVSKIDEDGTVKTKAVTDFAQAYKFGLDPADLYKEFRMNGKMYKVVGLVPRRHKYPVVCECDGRKYKISADMVKLYLKK